MIAPAGDQASSHPEHHTIKPSRRVEVPGPGEDSARDQQLHAVWRRVQLHLRASVPESTYRLWFEPLRPAGARGTTIFLTATPHVRRWVGRRYPELLRAALSRADSGFSDAEFVAEPGADERASATPAEAAARIALNPSYTFERFVIGPGSRLAHGAALAVAEAPGQAYNPLFLHGPPGLGKTHLLGAIANYLHDRSPGLDIHYTTAESFTNEFVGCLRSKGIDAFKERYRRADVLLIDDVQFLQGKARTADEFFHTFNALHQNGAQIVLTADRMPSELTELAERLRQRFEWGMTAEIDPPDLSTRLIFLGNLVREQGIEVVAPEAIRLIATRAISNLRALEGALTRVLAVSSLTDAGVTPETVDDVLPGGRPFRESGPAGDLSAQEIQTAVAAQLEVSRDQLLSPSRTMKVSRARQLAMYLTRELTDLSLPEIARAFKRRDHTTVMHAIRRVEEGTTRDPTLARELEELSSSLRSDSLGRDRTE